MDNYCAKIPKKEEEIWGSLYADISDLEFTSKVFCEEVKRLKDKYNKLDSLFSKSELSASEKFIYEKRIECLKKERDELKEDNDSLFKQYISYLKMIL